MASETIMYKNWTHIFMLMSAQLCSVFHQAARLSRFAQEIKHVFVSSRRLTATISFQNKPVSSILLLVHSSRIIPGSSIREESTISRVISDTAVENAVFTLDSEGKVVKEMACITMTFSVESN